jgi:hypothetical protein
MWSRDRSLNGFNNYSSFLKTASRLFSFIFTIFELKQNESKNETICKIHKFMKGLILIQRKIWKRLFFLTLLLWDKSYIFLFIMFANSRKQKNIWGQWMHPRAMSMLLQGIVKVKVINTCYINLNSIVFV